MGTCTGGHGDGPRSLSLELMSPQSVSVSWHCSNKLHQVENDEVGKMKKQKNPSQLTPSY